MPPSRQCASSLRTSAAYKEKSRNERLPLPRSTRHCTVRTAAIFRGRLATAANAARIDAGLVQRQTLLDSHFVLPGVAEVVFVDESLIEGSRENSDRRARPTR